MIVRAVMDTLDKTMKGEYYDDGSVYDSAEILNALFEEFGYERNRNGEISQDFDMGSADRVLMEAGVTDNYGEFWTWFFRHGRHYIKNNGGCGEEAFRFDREAFR